MTDGVAKISLATEEDTETFGRNQQCRQGSLRAINFHGIIPLTFNHKSFTFTKFELAKLEFCICCGGILKKQNFDAIFLKICKKYIAMLRDKKLMLHFLGALIHEKQYKG